MHLTLIHLICAVYCIKHINICQRFSKNMNKKYFLQKHITKIAHIPFHILFPHNQRARFTLTFIFPWKEKNITDHPKDQNKDSTQAHAKLHVVQIKFFFFFLCRCAAKLYSSLSCKNTDLQLFLFQMVPPQLEVTCLISQLKL